MALRNSKHGYGALTKLFHWLTVLLFAFQYFAGIVMTRMQSHETALGFAQSGYYNWHKSIGLVALAVALFRLLARKSGELPDWAPTLSLPERRFIHRAEQVLYAAMFIMPVSGYLYVMAGGYGVVLFGVMELANPIGKLPGLAAGAKWVHITTAFMLAAAILAHAGLILRHQFVVKDNLLARMLPRRGSF